jgi:hypothetical protein
MIRNRSLLAVGCVLLLAASGLAGEPIFDSRAGHPWDDARDTFYVRRFATGEVYEHPHAFAPPWSEYRPFVHDVAFYEQVVARLEAVQKLPVAQMEEQPAVRRLIFLRDLWPVFDGLRHARVDASGDKEATAKAAVRREDLLRRVARLMRRLELTGEEIRALPNALAIIRDKKLYPQTFDPASPDAPFVPADLLDTDGPWVAYSRDKSPSAGGQFHVEFVKHRSVFTLHLRTPSGRDEAVKYLNDFAKNNPRQALPTGSTLALLRRALVPARDGRPLPSPFVESLQLIVVTKEFDKRLKFTLDRKDLLAGGTGLKRIGKDDPLDPSSFESIFSYNRVMPIPPPPPTFPPTEPLILGQYKSVRALPRSLRTCVECHGEVTRSNILAANFQPKNEPYVQPTDPAGADATVVKIKEASDLWKSYLRLREETK